MDVFLVPLANSKQIGLMGTLKVMAPMYRVIGEVDEQKRSKKRTARKPRRCGLRTLANSSKNHTRQKGATNHNNDTNPHNYQNTLRYLKREKNTKGEETKQTLPPP